MVGTYINFQRSVVVFVVFVIHMISSIMKDTNENWTAGKRYLDRSETQETT
jgi:hypothetical protein